MSSSTKVIQGLLDTMTGVIERCQRDLPVLAEHADRWKRGYSGPSPAGEGGRTATTLTPTERLASPNLPGGKRQPDPSRDVANFRSQVEHFVKVGMKLDEERARLLPLEPEVARKLVDGDVDVCRSHKAADLVEPLIREDGARDGLCRWCYEFRSGRDGKGGYGVDPSAVIVRKHHNGEWITQAQVNAELSKPKPQSPKKKARKGKRR